MICIYGIIGCMNDVNSELIFSLVMEELVVVPISVSRARFFKAFQRFVSSFLDKNRAQFLKALQGQPSLCNVSC